MNRIPAEPEAAAPVRVLTVDDQEVFRIVAREVIDATPGFEPIGDVSGGEEALSAVQRLDPEMVLLDVRMPGLDGVEVARRLRATNPGTLVVLISVEEPMDIPSAAAAGRHRPAGAQAGSAARGCCAGSGANTAR